jgi:hypothetical protein
VEPEGPAKCLPPLYEIETTRVGVHVCPSARQPVAMIRNDLGERSVEVFPDRHYAQQLGRRRSGPAAHTGADRDLATTRDEVYRATPSAVGLGAVTAGPSSTIAGLVSDRMSIRQPVRRAASRAFCPSLPMARDSW